MLLSAAVVFAALVALVTLPSLPWWPGWVAIGAWWSLWWPAVAAVAAGGGGITWWRRSARPLATSAPATASLWVPGSDGWTRSSGPQLSASMAQYTVAKRGRDWSKVTSMVTAFTALAALVYTGDSLTATREQNALAEQGQIAGRYTSAVEQTGTQGDDHLQTRLGGVYALERLMIDSPRYQPIVIEVLSEFVRGRVPHAAPVTSPGIPSSTGCPRNDTGPKADVQAALTVLGRRNPQQDANVRINLGLTCLSSANLKGSHLENANLEGAYLDKAAFEGASLVGANLDGAYLAGASFGSNAKLDQASLSSANLSSTFLGFSSLRGARLAGANLTGANLTCANFTDANFLVADLTDAHLTQVNFTSASLSSAELVRADLDRANFTDAGLSRANFTGADLTYANLTGADLTYANFTGANFTGSEGLSPR